MYTQSHTTPFVSVLILPDSVTMASDDDVHVHRNTLISPVQSA